MVIYNFTKPNGYINNFFVKNNDKNMLARRDVFQAIADPTRRAIIGLLAGQTMTLNGVAENFSMSQPAISKHMRILTECGLVVMIKQGREKHCSANFAALREVADWTAQYRSFWNNKLDKLEHLLKEK